ncbi:hypothetical protein [Streptomyces sp. NPDC059411]
MDGADESKLTVSPDQKPEETSKNPIARLMLRSQSTLTWLASLAGIAFITLNSGYVDFYEKMGTRPEDVGLDRIAILARTASFIYMAIAGAVAGMLLLWVYRYTRKQIHSILAFVSSWVLVVSGMTFIAYSRFTKHPSDVGAIFMVLPASLAIWELARAVSLQVLVVSGRSSPGSPEQRTDANAGIAESGGRPEAKRGDKFLARIQDPKIIFVVIAALLGFGLWVENLVISAKVNSAVTRGKEVHPISFFSYPILDISASRAHVTWLDKDVLPPRELNDPKLLYVGRNPSFVSFLACGHPVMVPALKVSVELRSNTSPSEGIASCECISSGKQWCVSGSGRRSTSAASPLRKQPSSVPATGPILPRAGESPERYFSARR